jgi:hypothetical protein
MLCRIAVRGVRPVVRRLYGSVKALQRDVYEQGTAAMLPLLQAAGVEGLSSCAHAQKAHAQEDGQKC